MLNKIMTFVLMQKLIISRFLWNFVILYLCCENVYNKCHLSDSGGNTETQNNTEKQRKTI